MKSSETSKTFPEAKSIVLPPKPKEPSQDDCCGNGCIPCVFDIYEQECKIWQKQCLALLSPTDETERVKSVIPIPDEYTQFKVSLICQVSPNSFIMTFKPKKEDQRLSIDIGQHLVLRCCHNDEVVTRQYSPIYVASNYFEVIVKIYPDGKMSAMLKDVTEGMDLDWRGPFGEFTYSKNQYKEILMLAAGTGIAPMIRIIENIVEDEDEETRIRLLYSNKKFDEILLKKKVDTFKAFWNFTVLYILTQEKDPSKEQYGDKIRYERIDSYLVTSELAKMETSHTLVLICGTRNFEMDMFKFAIDAGMDSSNCFKF